MLSSSSTTSAVPPQACSPTAQLRVATTVEADAAPSRTVVATNPRRSRVSGTVRPPSVTLAVDATGTVTVVPSFSKSVRLLGVSARIFPRSTR